MLYVLKLKYNAFGLKVDFEGKTWDGIARSPSQAAIDCTCVATEFKVEADHNALQLPVNTQSAAPLAYKK